MSEPQKPSVDELERALDQRANEREAAAQRLLERLNSFDDDASAEATVSSRGFTHLDPVAGTYGGDVRVYESSAAEHPHVWLRVECPADLNRPDGETVEAVVHLPIEGAMLLARQLIHLVELVLP